jgi:hypothetical protein
MIMESMSLSQFWQMEILLLVNTKPTRCFCLVMHIITYLLHGAQSYLRSYPVHSKSKNSPHFMEPKSSILYSYVPVTCPYLEPALSSPCLHVPLPEDIT